MSRSLTLSAYLALHRGVERKDFAKHVPPRPNGPLIWLRGHSPDQAAIATALARQFGRDGDKASFLVTGTGVTSEKASIGPLVFQPSPEETVAGVRAFLGHWKPDLLVWLDGVLDPISLAETDKPRLPRFLANTDGRHLMSTVGTWVPGMTSRLLERFDRILATDQKAVARLRKSGAAADRIEAVGTMDEGLPLLGHSEHERQSLATALGPRPIWLATTCAAAELELVTAAHRLASRRAHRLLLIVVPDDPETGAASAQRLRMQGFEVALRSEGVEPEDSTQIYVADTAGELGLWYRIAPITYLGGSLTGGCRNHPFEAASLGSAVVHGPNPGPYSQAFDRLGSAGGARPIQTPDDLGPAIEALLSPDKAAQLANAAWSVTTEGAEVSNRLVGLIQTALDQMGR